jgi:NADH pyrophosphatase NudC (nudix superfamily)
VQTGDDGKSAAERVAEALGARQIKTTLHAGDDLETLISARRKEPSSTTGDDLEALIAARRRARQEKASGFCPNCGKPVQESDRFCPKCGARL